MSVNPRSIYKGWLARVGFQVRKLHRQQVQKTQLQLYFSKLVCATQVYLQGLVSHTGYQVKELTQIFMKIKIVKICHNKKLIYREIWISNARPFGIVICTFFNFYAQVHIFYSISIEFINPIYYLFGFANQTTTILCYYHCIFMAE